MKSPLAFALVLVTLGAFGCSGASGEAGGSNAPEGSHGGGVASREEIARLHRSRCGACHVRVEPGQRSREVLDAALTRHRKRVSMYEEQWAAMIDYLAPARAGAKDETTTRQ
jgi:hypothetical protein